MPHSGYIRTIAHVESQEGDLVECVLPDDQGNAVRRAKFVAICDRDDTVVYKGHKADAAWVRWIDGDDVDLLGKVSRGPLKPA